MNRSAAMRSLTGLVVILLTVAVAALAAQGQAVEDPVEQVPGPADGAPGVSWLTYREAMAMGRDTDRPILLHFTAGYSGDCRKMKRETYSELKVFRYLNENFAVAMVDVDQLPSLARKFQVESLPTLWFLDASGKPLTSINGDVGPEKMLRVAEYISAKIYLHTDYDTWRDKRARR